MSASNFTRLFDIPGYQNYRFPNKEALCIKREGKQVKFSSRKLVRTINRLSVGLLNMGFKRGDKIGIMSHHGSPEWNIADFACQQIGLIVVPLHHNYKHSDLSHILDEILLSACFVSREDWAEQVKIAGREDIPLIGFRKIKGTIFWKSLLNKASDDEKIAIGKIKESISPDDLATIIYTSGATGKPKGVMLSHDNICSNIKSIIPLIPINYRSRVASYLPLSHIFERMVSYTYLTVGASIHYIEDQQHLLEEVRAIQPNYITAVPRILERIHAQILEGMNQLPFIQKKFVAWALKKGESYEADKSDPLYFLKIRLADLFVYRRWRKILGGKIRGIAVGAAALPSGITKLFNNAGIPVREGYGLTETSPVISFNRFEPGGMRTGTVGIPIPGVELRISRDIDEESSLKLNEGEGEIQVRGPNVMLGYYLHPEDTKACMTADGWFKTGDIGRIVHTRFLQITDRKKDIFKTTSGRYIAPQKLEKFLLNSRYIDQAMIVGMGRPNAAALIVPDFNLLKKWCESNDIHWTAPLYMTVNNKVEAFFSKEISTANAQLSSFEQIGNFCLLSDAWAVETGELTPTLKLKRHFIQQKYAGQIESLYKA
jgi:long-chain acyl-CoA synthetase